ncbi:hypothetical protein GGH95_005357, partial [Coemansia sp. RSA 1836]
MLRHTISSCSRQSGSFLRNTSAVAGSRAVCHSRRPTAIVRPCRYTLLSQRQLLHTTPKRLTASSAVRSLEPEGEEPAAIPVDDGPIGEYRRLVHTGQFIDDSFQRLIVSRLDRLYRDLLDYTPAKPPSPKPLNSSVGYLRK